MAAGHVQVPPDSTGKDVDADALTSTEGGTPTVYRQNMILADPVTYANKAVVGKNGGLAVRGSPIAAQTLNVTAATPVTGTGLDVSEAGNVTFIVKNTVAATAYTGVPVIVFEQSDDNTSWAPLPVSCGGLPSAQPLIATGAANAEQMFDAGMEGVNWVRVRVVTAQAANGMTVVTQPGGLSFSPVVAVQPPARTSLVSGTAAAGVTAGTSVTEALITVAQCFRGGTTFGGGTLTTVPITAGKTFRVTGFGLMLKCNGAVVSSVAATLRYNPAGAATAASAPMATLYAAVPAVTGTASTANSNYTDGVELPGGATPGQYGISIFPTWATTAPTVWAWLAGYEY